MTNPLNSLRGRLVAAMLLVFTLGLGGATVLRPFEAHLSRSEPWGLGMLREPYQDILVLVLFSLCAVALIWLVSGWSLRHLAATSRDAAAIGASNPEARLSPRRLPGEIRPLVDAVNGALDRLAQAYAAEQRFVADAAHELRTPLTVLTLRLQRARLDAETDWPAIEHDLAQVNRLASQLLDLARKERAHRTDPIDAVPLVNLSRIAREAAAAIIPLAEAAGRPLDVYLPPVLPIRGRAGDLRDMVRNLLDNALLHGHGTIRLAGQIHGPIPGARQVSLTVGDAGAGIPPAMREAVFERFRKGDPDSAGSGLGLAIVREVVRAHGGTVAFLPGPGCQVRVGFRAVESADSPDRR